jgi:hypothetical protein
MVHETAGDPISGLKWAHKTTERIATELHSLGIAVSARAVPKLLKKLGFSLRVNHKKRANGSPLQRDAQFAYLSELRERFANEANPVISVDTKKKELVGHLRTTTTPTGLRVRAHLVRRTNRIGKKISNAQMNQLPVNKHDVHRQKNYTLSLTQNGK